MRKKFIQSEMALFSGFLCYKRMIFPEPVFLAAEQLNFLSKVIYPKSYLSWQVKGRRDTFIDRHSFPPLNKVVGMGNDLLFGSPWHAVTGG
jgi:hypothetical protein